MDVRTTHRTEVTLTTAEWFRADLRTGYGELQVRRITALWSSDRVAPVLTLDGVRVVRGKVSAEAESQMLWAWRDDDREFVLQIPSPIRQVLEAIGMALPS